MILVLDTNVLAAGAISRSSVPAKLLAAWHEGWFSLAISDHILAELRRTLDGAYFRKRLPSDSLQPFMDEIQRHATMTAITKPVSGIATHPEDDLVIATALSADADFIITYDRQLLKIGWYEEVGILHPDDALRALESQSR